MTTQPEQPLFALFLSALILGLVFPGGLSANDVSGDHNDTKYGATLADALVEFVGLGAQIDRTADTIVAEVTAALEECETQVHNAGDRSAFLRSLYAPEALADAAREMFNENLSREDKAVLQKWISSPLGMKVYDAESALQDVDPDTLPELESALIASEEWTQERQREIYRILRATRVHHYVAALNTALSAAIAMGSSCESDFGSLNSIEIAQQREKGDEKLVAGLMLQGFIVPTGVILKPLDAAELKDYFLFSVTPVGRKWYALVIDTVRAIVTERIPQIRQYIEQRDEAVTGSLEDD